MTYEQAEYIALQALVYITADEDILLAYLKLSGMSLENLRNCASDPVILGSILDYFLQNEKRLIAFCDEYEILPPQIALARKSLPGGEDIAEYPGQDAL